MDIACGHQPLVSTEAELGVLLSTLQGDFRAKKFDIVQVGRGKGRRVIASVKKESRFSSATAFLM